MESQAQKAKPEEGGLYMWKRFAAELLGTFLLAHVFCIMAIYNAGIIRSFVSLAVPIPDTPNDYYYSSSDPYLFPIWLQPVCVFLGLYIVHKAGAELSGFRLHLNPFVSTVVNMAKYNNQTKENSNYVSSLLYLVWEWFAQLLGTLGGVAVVYAFSSNGTLSSVAQFLGGDGTTTPTQMHLAGVSDVLIGTVGLLVVSYVAYEASHVDKKVVKENRKMSNINVDVWAFSIAGFYFLYMLFFWVHSKATIDFFRSFWLCVFVQADDESSKCSYASTWIERDGGLVGLHFIFQAIIIIIVILLATIKKFMDNNKS